MSAALPAIDALPGFRRRLRVTPGVSSVQCEVEDDYHCMTVTLRHDGKTVTAIDAEMVRAPWTTCPGAVAKLQETFTGIELKAFAKRGEKRANCTHLHDLAVLAAAHAFDRQPLVYDVLVSDAVEGRSQVQLRRNGTPLLGWVDAQGQILEPAGWAGVRLDASKAWIESLDLSLQEAARILCWARTLAHGRAIPLEKQSDASRMPVGNCFTFQAERAGQARRVGKIRDFSNGTEQPLERRQTTA